MTLNNKKNYRLIQSGKNLRREYLHLNRSDLFLPLPEIDISQEQKKSFFDFINTKLKQLLNFYFPVEFEDHNNSIALKALDFRLEEPEISIAEAQKNFLSWSYKVFLKWAANWKCNSINILLEENLSEEENIQKWLEKSFFSFKAENYTLSRKSDLEWEAEEKKGSAHIIVNVLEKKEESLLVTFRYQQSKDILLCHLPKINEQGIFIINGHYKVSVCQSVRSPDVYSFFNQEQAKHYSEIIPTKGSWISIYFNLLVKRIELKFLNSKKIVSLQDVLFSHGVSDELFELLLTGFEEKKLIKKTYEDGPKFLFNVKNSYFDFGSLGRKKFNRRMLLSRRLLNQTLAEDIYNTKQELVLPKETFLNSENISVLQQVLLEGVNSFSLPNSTNKVSWVKIKSVSYPETTISVIGIVEELPLTKVYFDISDLFCVVSSYLNVRSGVGTLDLETDKDKLNNQVLRRIGDLLYGIFDSKLGGFLYQDMAQKYLANISQLKKTDLAKMPNLKDFDNSIKSFFNVSPLVQLQNQNNPLSENAYTRKVSVLGLGGFTSSNITLSTRNVDESHYGRLGLMCTQEGKNFGLTHNLTLGAVIDQYGQITAPYFKVKNGIVQNEIQFLTSDEESEQYISHCNIKIALNNEIEEERLLVRHKGKIFWVEKNIVNFIDSSFFHLTSLEESLGPFTPYNDATRTLMTSNMQRGAIPPVKNEEPLVATGAESLLRKNSYLSVKASEPGEVVYVDNQKIIVRNLEKKNRTYLIDQASISNKDILNFSYPIVKKGDKIKEGDFLADGQYSKNGELSMGCNLRVAYLSSYSNFEDAIVFSDRLIKEDIFTYVMAKEYSISRYNTEYGPEVFSSVNLFTNQKNNFSHLDSEGIVKIGSVISSNSVIVRKLVPKIVSNESEEEMLLLKILGGRGQKYTDSSLYLPKNENSQGVVYKVERTPGTFKDELETVKVFVAFERKIEDGDKVTARYGNKGVIKVVPEANMPYTEEGTFDMILNPLGVPSRMNMGQLLESVLAEAAYRLNIKLLIRPFNNISLSDVKELAEEAGIKEMGNRTVWDGKTSLSYDKKVHTGRLYTTLLNHKSADKIHARSTGPYSIIFQQPLKGRKRDGGQRVGEMEGWCLEAHGAAKTLLRLFSSDDIQKRQELQSYLLFGKRKFNLLYNRSESFNLTLQYLRGMGFNLEGKDFQDKNVDFYKRFCKTK